MKCVHKTGPDEDESGGHGADHGEADQHIEEVKELGAEGPGHQQRNEDRTEERRHAIEDEGAAIDDEQDCGCDAQAAPARRNSRGSGPAP